MTQEIRENTPIKEFMEWFVSQYEGYYLPSDCDGTINLLQGYAFAKQGTEEYSMIMSAITLLRNFQTLLRVIKQYTGWKYGG